MPSIQRCNSDSEAALSTVSAALPAGMSEKVAGRQASTSPSATRSQRARASGTAALAAAPATAPPARNKSTCCGVNTTCRASQNWLAPSGARESCAVQIR